MQPTPNRPRRSIFLLIFLLLLFAAESQAEVVGFTGFQAEVVELFLTEDGDVIPEGQRWQVPGVGIVAVERDVAGSIYVVGALPISANGLYSLDLDTGEVASHGLLGLAGQFDLAFDESGILWISTADELHTYDPDTGDLSSVTPIQSGIADGIAWWQGNLYAVMQPAGADSGPTLGVIDTTDGVFTEIRELPGLAADDPFFRFFDAIDFDRQGGLWLGFDDSTGIIDPPLTMSGVAYFPDPLSGDEPVIRYLDPSNTWFQMPLAVTGSISAIDVPALSDTGLAMLIALMSIVALGRLRGQSYNRLSSAD